MKTLSGLPGMCTIHANSAREAITKMCTLPALAGENVSARFVVPTVAASLLVGKEPHPARGRGSHTASIPHSTAVRGRRHARMQDAVAAGPRIRSALTLMPQTVLN